MSCALENTFTELTFTYCVPFCNVLLLHLLFCMVIFRTLMLHITFNSDNALTFKHIKWLTNSSVIDHKKFTAMMSYSKCSIRIKIIKLSLWVKILHIKYVGRKMHGHLLSHDTLCSFFPLVSDQAKPDQLLLHLSQFCGEREKKEKFLQKQKWGILFNLD